MSPLAATTFDLRGVALAPWTLVAFAIGVAGILIRRVVPAMFATLVAWSGLAVVGVLITQMVATAMTVELGRRRSALPSR